MPRRPEAHTIGDIGESQVSQVFLSCGWACDKTLPDYGEDLVVQPSLQGNVDPFRILVQVKSTNTLSSFRTKTYGYSLLVPVDLAIKWSRSDSIVIVVIWDIKAQKGLWTRPVSQIDAFTAYIRRSAKIRLTFDEANQFSAASMATLVWRLRLEHFNQLITMETTRLKHAGSLGHDTKAIERRLNSILFDLFRTLGIIRDDLIDSEFRQWMENGKHNLAEDFPDDPPEVITVRAGFLALLAWVEDHVVQGGMPHELVNAGSLFAASWLDVVERIEQEPAEEA